MERGVNQRVATPAGMAEVPPGMAYDRASNTFVTVEEMRRREADREERAFMRRANQGAFPTPQIMRDFRHDDPTRMTDGTIVSSRAEKREYQARTGLVDYDPGIQREVDHWTYDYDYRADLLGDLRRAVEEDPINHPSKEKQWEDAGFKDIGEVEAITSAAAAPEAPAADSFLPAPENLAAQT